MRIIASIPHPSISISVFQMNEKYIVKFEAGPMEQAFKFTTEQVKGLEHIKEIVNDAFIENVRKRFNEMYLQLQESTK
ncbi:MAG: hypothetical protein K0S33_2307 [Bacteroidetes bacterium]|jgi:hypothetical protein|nr:hypothetical protein [Bacteroidota bacterium]